MTEEETFTETETITETDDTTAADAPDLSARVTDLEAQVLALMSWGAGVDTLLAGLSRPASQEPVITAPGPVPGATTTTVESLPTTVAPAPASILPPEATPSTTPEGVTIAANPVTAGTVHPMTMVDMANPDLPTVTATPVATAVPAGSLPPDLPIIVPAPAPPEGVTVADTTQAPEATNEVPPGVTIQ